MEIRDASGCPVPTEQQPINEYLQLKESWFFSWATRNWWGYLRPMGVIWCLSWLVTGPIAAASFPPGKYPLRFALSGSGGACLFLALVVLKLYLGWEYVLDRLARPTVFYEESGWYDGCSWTKTPEILQRDQLIVTYQIQPIRRRLRLTLGGILLVLLAGGIGWYFL